MLQILSGQENIDDKEIIHNVGILKMAKVAWMDDITGKMLKYELLIEQLNACGNVTEVLLLGT